MKSAVAPGTVSSSVRSKSAKPPFPTPGVSPIVMFNDPSADMIRNPSSSAVSPERFLSSIHSFALIALASVSPEAGEPIHASSLNTMVRFGALPPDEKLHDAGATAAVVFGGTDEDDSDGATGFGDVAFPGACAADPPLEEPPDPAEPAARSSETLFPTSRATPRSMAMVFPPSVAGATAFCTASPT